MQTNDTLILGNQLFLALYNRELRKANLKAKLRECFTDNIKLIFNSCIIQNESNNV